MGTGRQLGQQLQHWLREKGPATLPVGNALANRWSDALGSDDSLRPPLRDLAHRPLFRQALAQQGAAQLASLEQLGRELRRTYSQEVMAELLDLLEAFADVTLPRNEARAGDARANGSAPGNGSTHDCASRAPESWNDDPRSKTAGGARLWLKHSGSQLRRLRRRLEPMAPGIALAAAAALVWTWLGRELDRLLFEGWGWSGGTVLLLLLALIEGLGLLQPLRRWQRAGLLRIGQNAASHQAWRWITAPWQQPSRRQAALNLGLLAVILGPSALQLPDVLLRYSLVSLATLTLAALVAAGGATAVQREGNRQALGLAGGASGAVASLIALGVGLSLLQGRQLSYGFGPLTVPAWVLLLISAGFELSWMAHTADHASGEAAASSATAATERTPPLWSGRQLLSQPWSWGLLLGLSWAAASKSAEFL